MPRVGNLDAKCHLTRRGECSGQVRLRAEAEWTAAGRAMMDEARGSGDAAAGAGAQEGFPEAEDAGGSALHGADGGWGNFEPEGASWEHSQDE